MTSDVPGALPNWVDDLHERSPIARFLATEAAGGVVLIVAALVALVFANTPTLDRMYEYILEIPIELRLGELELKKNVLHVINDGLMAVFFLLVGLEIKREVLQGELSTSDRVVLPVLAALGGAALPAVIYAAFNFRDEAALRGWAIPTATDIAFSLGVLSLLGTRVPIALKVFLTAVAVVDDLAAIVIIAVFYTDDLSWLALSLGVVGVVVLTALNFAGVRRFSPYGLVGVLMWVCLVKSGVHATLAGVALGLSIPLCRELDDHTCPLRRLEHHLHPWVAFMILPLFAFANAGVAFQGAGSQVAGPVPLGIALGLILGKPIGVLAFSAAAVATGLARLPQAVTWSMMIGTGLLTGIGFTMSLFIGTLAFEYQGADFAVATRIGVFGGSILAAVAGFTVLAVTLPSARQPTES